MLFLAPIPATKEDEDFCSPLSPDMDVRDAFVSAILDLPISDRLNSILRSSIASDPAYTAAMSAYQAGWPSSRRDEVGQYWSLHHDFHCDDGLLFFDQKVVVPVSARPSFLEALHRGHVGVTAML
jgi:hypothetical protein